MLHKITRRKTSEVDLRKIKVGANYPVSVQSMTNTKTTDIDTTLSQIESLEKAGCDIIRISTPTKEDVKAFKLIREKTNLPLVADIHFDYRLALLAIDAGADCIRINPGNIGKIARVKAVVDAAKQNNVALRIGVNAGSLEKDIQEKYKEPNADALVESAMRHVQILHDLNFNNFKISVKASNIFLAVDSYTKLANLVDNPLHLGITEAGNYAQGSIKSAIGLGMLLAKGIGDTIRVSLAADPVDEVKVGFNILKSLQIRSRGINFIACPTCARQEFDVIKVVNQLENRLEDITEAMDVSIIGCVVNGPGEALQSDLGLAGAKDSSGFYKDGKRVGKLDNKNLVDLLEKNIREKLKEKNKKIIEIIS